MVGERASRVLVTGAASLAGITVARQPDSFE
jgi:hypothetical protein